MTAQELHNKMLGFSSSYFLIDVHRDRDYFYALSDEEIQSTQSWLCYSGIVLNKIMDGQLEEAWQIINNMPVEKMGYFKLLPLGLTVVHPGITWKQLFEKVDILKKLSVPQTNRLVDADMLVSSSIKKFNRKVIFRHRCICVPPFTKQGLRILIGTMCKKWRTVQMNWIKTDVRYGSGAKSL
ncbi:MAG: hypothetical protein II684_00720 [Treponema sp.]|nr:hypothetical protein [Treponema sp.]